MHHVLVLKVYKQKKWDVKTVRTVCSEQFAFKIIQNFPEVCVSSESCMFFGYTYKQA